jgi:Tfp pilus assembly protein PilE
MQRFKEQSGRSMIEMLGVLAIVGVLSVGALAGYSMAMENYKANQAVEEIRGAILGVKDLYSDRNNYENLTSTVALDAGIFTKHLAGSPRNYFELAFGVSEFVVDFKSAVQMEYGVPNENICRKILLSGLDVSMGEQSLRTISVWDGSAAKRFNWTGTYDYQFPVNVGDAAGACVGAQIIYFYFR